MRGEFDFIAALRKTSGGSLGQKRGSRGFRDDVAALSLAEKSGFLVISKDICTAGTHFFADDPADLILKKALRVNISDLAAKGAAPYGAFIGVIFPKTASKDALPRLQEEFLTAIEEDCEKYHLGLLGGDIAIGDTLAISVTILGLSPSAPPIRSGAKLGHDVYVTGVLGLSALGLDVRCGLHETLDPSHAEFLQNRYLLPDPPLAAGRALFPYMRASCDISDGLLADLGHILTQSDVGAELDAAHLPIDTDFPDKEAALKAALTGGDDYQILFTTDASEAEINRISKETATPIRKIGRIVQTPGLRLLNADGADIAPLYINRPGHRHF